MAITGISAISGEQIIAAGAVSAREAGKASFTTGGNDIQNLYDTVYTNSASWTGGSSTVYVDSASVLGGDGSQADPLTLRYDTNTLDKAVGSTTVTLTAGADGCAVIEANSDLAVYMGSHAVTFNFQGIGLSGSKRYIGMSLTPVGGGDILYLEASGSINAYSSECTFTIDTRDQPDWATRVQWDSTKSWKIYMNESEDPWPQIVYTTASTTIPGGSYSLTVKNPLPSINGHFATEALVIDSYGNAAWSDIRTVPTVNVAGKVLKSNTGNTYSWADAVTTVNTTGCIVGDGSTASPVSINIDTETLEVQSVGGTDLPIVNGYAFIAANSDIAKYMRDGNTYHVVTFTMSGFTPAAYSRTVGLTIERPNESYYVPGFSGTLAANATSCTITVDVRDYAEWGSGPFTSDHDWILYTYEDDSETWPAMPYTSCTHNGPAVTVDKLAVKNPLPASTSADENKVLTVNAAGTPEWQTAGGASYTGDAQGALDEVYSKSANWDGSYDTLTANSAYWSAAEYRVRNSSANWNKSYTAVTNNSAAWGGSALPISAGPGVKMDVVNDVLVFSNDETVLWEGTTGSSACTLSEPMTNFKSIKILFGNGAGSGAYKNQYAGYYEVDPNFTDFNYIRGKGNANVWWSWIRVAATDRSNITVPATKSFNFGSQTASAWQNPNVSVNNIEDRNCLYKIVGINRTASN